jgi:uncharacterized protein
LPRVDVNLPSTPVPMFPLPGAFLFPHQALPLHIFETRYRAMVTDLLDGPGRFVLATQLAVPQANDFDLPPVLPVAGLGEIVRHEKLPDGRFMIWVLGLTRVILHEVPSEHRYRLVRCAQFPEIDVPQDERDDLAELLRAAMSSRLRGPLPPGAPTGLLADLLLQAMRPSPDVLARAFAEPSIAARARYVLAEAEKSPPPSA